MRQARRRLTTRMWCAKSPAMWTGARWAPFGPMSPLRCLPVEAHNIAMASCLEFVNSWGVSGPQMQPF